MANNYKDRLRAKKIEEEEVVFEKCCDNPCIESRDGDNVCLNCGMIVGRNLVGNERRAYTVEEVNKRRRTEPRWREFGPRTMLPNFWEAKPKLKMLTSKMNIPEYIKETAWKIYSVVAKKKLTMGRSIDGFIAASLYAAIRVHEFPRLLEEVCDASMTPRRTVHRSLGMIVKEVLPELGLKYKPITAEQLVFRFGNDLGLPMEVQKKAINMLVTASKNGLLRTGKDPKGLAASVIYMAAKASNCRKTQAEVSEVAKVTEVTLRSRSKQIKSKL
ncbi:MAG: transcription initiation factor IIB [Promethearchaeota archaeon]